MPHPGHHPTHIITRHAPRQLLIFVLITSSLTVACAPNYASTTASRNAPALLKLDVEPDTAEIYLNDDYHGVVNRWRDHTLNLTPGAYRLELRAPGHIPQRFDLDLPADQITRLRLRLEPDLHSPEPADDAPSTDPLHPPSPPDSGSPDLP
ncbi:carboxypeptidase regulatory-like domain-containing protein [Bradymonadaceae bacterium TMQ3]|uniref:Carboxypeptidase regulatory-like domain-containing protein n=1 Tax=Lujinxingia sediminis TaxID=2480984 RepID=A0ABY0CV30_9DELT|nr:carboxypeptidase regulatory-like domain-containing protein [Lujinxingia sediminis]RDV36687.1 carboxypeptidase regulatory-like domain-containing protein [Bradymonadaceae bacterium TMQ3]RVU46923.1 carboxypeptidase regulatory-like domain-containing protein [Lujinxingia sediminis]TXC68534.1 carboxypeptidase regulatory-like domain-containing protein [Bradymonadales bacterium TMQ1]